MAKNWLPANHSIKPAFGICSKASPPITGLPPLGEENLTAVSFPFGIGGVELGGIVCAGTKVAMATRPIAARSIREDQLAICMCRPPAHARVLPALPSIHVDRSLSAVQTYINPAIKSCFGSNAAVMQMSALGH